jgi:hypothetical protein
LSVTADRESPPDCSAPISKVVKVILIRGVIVLSKKKNHIIFCAFNKQSKVWTRVTDLNFNL